MNGDIGIVKQTGLAVLYKREVVTVNLGRSAIRQIDVPILSLDVDNIDIVALLVEKRIESLCGAQ